MNDDGKKLELLVRDIEGMLLPAGFSVKSNRKVFNDEGIQVAEFDIEIKGKLGSGEIAWLIECRDRPSNGPAPGSWIEQLVGRRDRFGFNKVTAVSTTGFAQGASEFARERGIELRTVADVSADEVVSWLSVSSLTFLEQTIDRIAIRVGPSESTSPECLQALRETLKDVRESAPILRSSKTGQSGTARAAFLGALPNAFDDLLLNGGSKVISLGASYPDDNSHFLIDTPLGPVRINRIKFEAELSVKQIAIPIASVAEYRGNEAQDLISQTVAFEVDSPKGNLLVQMHNLAETGEARVTLRRG